MRDGTGDSRVERSQLLLVVSPTTWGHGLIPAKVARSVIMPVAHYLQRIWGCPDGGRRRGITWMSSGCAELVPPLHWLRSSGELAPPLTDCSSWESRPCFSLKQHNGAGPGGRDVGSWPRGHECGRVDSSSQESHSQGCELWRASLASH